LSIDAGEIAGEDLAFSAIGGLTDARAICAAFIG
jgi:hypothetical protein